jgi:hypothetical protein
MSRHFLCAELVGERCDGHPFAQKRSQRVKFLEILLITTDLRSLNLSMQYLSQPSKRKLSRSPAASLAYQGTQRGLISTAAMPWPH